MDSYNINNVDERLSSVWFSRFKQILRKVGLFLMMLSLVLAGWAAILFLNQPTLEYAPDTPAPGLELDLAVIFLFHPLLGYLACAGALLLLLLVVAQDVSTSRMQARPAQSSLTTEQFLSSSLGNAQTVYAMGMFPAMSRKWKQLNNRDIFYEDTLAARTGFFQSLAKFFMMGTVVVIMSTGAYLVIIHEATLGTMVAAAMFMSRALSPILMLGNAWRSLVEARHAYNRLDALTAQTEPFLEQDTKSPEDLAQPETCKAERISLSLGNIPVLKDVSLEIRAGEMVAVTGSSGSGKTTLARILLGLWQPDSGRVLLGDKPIDQVDAVSLGRKIGYMPQEVDLFSGTVAENIARLGEVDSPAVVNAAMEAGVHDMILELPQGYDTHVGPGGIPLSQGQKQRIVLARALYSNPWLIVLDEPDSHLDQSGREKLKELLVNLKKKGVFLVVITHNRELFRFADRILHLEQGNVMENGDSGNQGTEN